jgi:hypothetical protein
LLYLILQKEDNNSKRSQLLNQALVKLSNHLIPK